MATREVLRDDDGNVIAEMCVATPLTDEERTAFAEFFGWVKTQLPPPTPDEIARQEASRRRIRERNQRLGIEVSDAD